jgi:hypothetical protein
MIRSMIVCLLAATTVLAFPADSAGGCPGGYAEGAEIERGRLIFVCQGGSVVPKGCIAEDLSRLSIGGNYDTKQYRKKCQLGSDGQLSYEVTGCVANGQEHKVDETFEDGTNFFVCKSDASTADPNDLKIVNQGCVDGGKRINIKDTVAKDDALYSCDETVNGGSKLVQAGCVKDGKQYKTGDSFEVGKYWFNCTRIGREKVSAKAAGCVANGKRLNDGDRYFENDVIYECTIDGDKTDVRSTGCVQNDGGSTVERRLGCTWVEGVAPIQYEWTCKHDAAKNSATKEQVRCNYNVGGGVYNIDPGCYRTIDGPAPGPSDLAAYGCVSTGGKLDLQTFTGANAEQSASGAGLHAC